MKNPIFPNFWRAGRAGSPRRATALGKNTVLLLLIASTCYADELTFRCLNARDHPADEISLLRDAPHGAERTGPHRLAITWARGKRIFIDKPPFNENLEGLHWYYCGYSAELKIHLLLKVSGTHFSGTILDDKTGSLLPGGQEIVFSPDRQYYLAYEMEDGDPTEILKLYRRTGALVWQGHSGLTSADGWLIAAFRELHWNDQNLLQTTATPVNGASFPVTLIRGRNGKWEWEPPPATAPKN